jgi:tRNA dimethylallyltransferase
MDQNPLLVILGPTASGKTKLAVSLAVPLKAEIISADSRQVFRDMDLGTGKDLQEYNLNGKNIPYHLIDILAAGEQYNVNAFKDDFYRVFETLTEQQVLPILCGGTGMYIHSLFQDHQYTAIPVNQELRDILPAHDISALRQVLAKYPDKLTVQADLSSSKRIIRAIEIADYLSQHTFTPQLRPVIKPLVIGLTSDVASRRERIYTRLNERLEEGLIDEVERLIIKGVSREVLTFYGLEYKFITAYLYKEHSLQDLKDKLFIAICQFAKRQMTFFRKMEKDGVKINWFQTGQEPEELKKDILRLYRNFFDKAEV